VRGAAVLTDRVWPRRTHWRVLGYLIDSLLLAAGVTLCLTLRLNPARDVWLGAKLLLLLLYIAAGSLAMKRGRTLAARGAFYRAAPSTDARSACTF